MGSGDGSYVINQARKNPNTLFIGVDSNAENLIANSRKTVIFKEKCGLNNALFVHASLEALPLELFDLASSITILLPWGSLLKAVAKPDIELLKKIKNLGRANSNIRIVFGYDSKTEQNQIEELCLPELTKDQLNKLIIQYFQAGFSSLQWRLLSQSELKTIASTWAKKLSYGKKREFIEIMGIIDKGIPFHPEH